MSTEENKLVVCQFIQDVVNTGDTDRLDDLISSDCLEHHGTERVHSGIDGMKDHIRAVREVYPDLHLTVERQIAEGDWVATQITARGTHTGHWMNMKPTGKDLTFTGVNLDRVVAGKIVEHGGATNMLGPFLEAGGLHVVGDGPIHPITASD